MSHHSGRLHVGVMKRTLMTNDGGRLNSGDVRLARGAPLTLEPCALVNFLF